MKRLLFVLGLIGVAVSSNTGAGRATGSATVDVLPGQPHLGPSTVYAITMFGGPSSLESFSELKGAVKRITWEFLDHGDRRREVFEFNAKGRVTKQMFLYGTPHESYEKFDYDSNSRMSSQESVRGDKDRSGILGRKYRYLESEKRNIAIEMEYRKEGWLVSKGYVDLINADGDGEYYLIKVSRRTAFGEKYLMSKDKAIFKQVSAVGSDLVTGTEIGAANENEAQARIVKLLDCLQQNTCGVSGKRRSAGDAGVPAQNAFGYIKSKEGDLDKLTDYWGETWYRNGLVQSFDNLKSQQTMVGGGSLRRERITFEYAYDANGNWTKRETFVNSVKSDQDTVTRKIEYYK